MKRRTLSLFHLVCASLALVEISACAHKPDVSGVQKANERFYSALNLLFTGDSGPMESFWSHSDSINYMGPQGGTLVGWSKIQEEWKRQATMKLGGKVEPKNVRITVGEDLAVVANTEIGENIGPDGQPLKVSIRATNVYRKEDGAWRMIGHHTDLLPFLSKYP